MKNIKICVRVPAAKKEELMLFAKYLRETDTSQVQRAPGWDAKVIHKIAKSNYGGLAGMFEKHKWQERGSDMMRFVQARVKETYGSIEQFAKEHGE